MARLPRFVLPGHPQHVIQRGNNRQSIFADDADRRQFLATLNDACQSFECRVHAYVLMTNHVHLLMTPDTTKPATVHPSEAPNRFKRQKKAVVTQP